MASYDIAAAKTLASEGGFSLNPRTLECVNFGITVWTLRALKYLPAQPALKAEASEIEYVHAMTREWALTFYRKHYWGTLDGLASQALADKAFDLEVNMGGIASSMLQRASNEVAGVLVLKVDGFIGPVSIARFNSQIPSALLTKYRAMAAARYRLIAGANPALAGDLDGWLARLAV